MEIKIALAGNPNCGKTTMFNDLTGSAQYVGNWPGVTVEKKEGKLKGAEGVVIQDLPGIYSLSPYTQEEVVARNYLVKDKPDSIINIVDTTNIERNLYLTTQLLELGIPTVLALNMMDVVEKNGDKIDCAKLSRTLGCAVVKTSALKGEGTKEAATLAAEKAEAHKAGDLPHIFQGSVEHALAHIEESIEDKVAPQLLRWYAVKLFERDEKIRGDLQLDETLLAHIEAHIKDCEAELDDDAESIITNQRYAYIKTVVDTCVKKAHTGQKMNTSDKIDRIVTNRILGIPIFLAVMFVVYYISISTIGTMGTDWANDVLFGEWIKGGLQGWLEGLGANEVLTDCIVNGIIGGVGTVLGFIPQMAVLFLLLCIVEDCGYMVRIAFVMDRIFRHFGLSGKSFIPLLVSSGCGVPGIMSSRTIENDNDRRLTIMTATWVPCSAKLPVIALMAGVLSVRTVGGIGGGALALLMYAVGIASVLLAAIMLKKTKPFHGPAAPFIVELPPYHVPQLKSVLIHTWERLKGFIVKAGTILFIACLVIWFLSSYGVAGAKDAVIAEDGTVIEEASRGGFGLVDSEDSILAKIGGGLSYIFRPLGFGTMQNADGTVTNNWQAAAASISGFSAKEAIVSTLGVLAGVDEDEREDADTVAGAIAAWFPTALGAFCFLLFNLLDSPCLAAISTMSNELKDRRWFWFAIGFQNVFAYVVTMIVFQFGMIFTGHFGEHIAGGIFAVAFAAVILFMLFRKDPYKGQDIPVKRSVNAAE